MTRTVVHDIGPAARRWTRRASGSVGPRSSRAPRRLWPNGSTSNGRIGASSEAWTWRLIPPSPSRPVRRIRCNVAPPKPPKQRFWCKRTQRCVQGGAVSIGVCNGRLRPRRCRPQHAQTSSSSAPSTVRCCGWASTRRASREASRRCRCPLSTLTRWLPPCSPTDRPCCKAKGIPTCSVDLRTETRLPAPGGGPNTCRQRGHAGGGRRRSRRGSTRKAVAAASRRRSRSTRCAKVRLLTRPRVTPRHLIARTHAL